MLQVFLKLSSNTYSAGDSNLELFNVFKIKSRFAWFVLHPETGLSNLRVLPYYDKSSSGLRASDFFPSVNLIYLKKTGFGSGSCFQ